jgi:hypothetical protein
MAVAVRPPDGSASRPYLCKMIVFTDSLQSLSIGVVYIRQYILIFI